MPFLVPAIGFSAMTFIVLEIYNRYDGLPPISSNVDDLKWTFLGLAIILMPINWLIESLKWGKLIDVFQSLSRMQKYQSVFYGVSASILTPNRIGDYGGRLRYIDKDNRLKALHASFVSSFYQTTVTLFFGILGLLIYITSFSNFVLTNGLYPILSVFTLVYLFLLFKMKSTIEWVLNFNWAARQQEAFNWFLGLSRSMLGSIFSLAAIRYFVFLIQYFLVFYFFNSSFNWIELASGIAILYLFTTIIPSGVVTDLIIRGAIGLVIFTPILQDEGTILWSIALIWIINLAIPALIGGILFLLYPFKRHVK